MKVSQYSKKVDKKIVSIFLGALLLLVIIGVLVFFIYYKVDTVTVEGSNYYSEDEIKEMVLTSPLSVNSVFADRMDVTHRMEDVPFIEKVSIEQNSRNSITIQVTEKKLVGYVRYLDGYLYFNRNGIITESVLEPLENIPYIEGLKFDRIVLGEALPVSNEDVFHTITGITRMIEKNTISPERIVLDDAYQITLYVGNIIVKLGNDNYMEEKIAHMSAIMPQIEGQEGILHLENVSNIAKTITFEVGVGEVIQSVEFMGDSPENSKEGSADQQ